MRIPLAAITLALLATPIDAATLCRDSKGLFTPCTGERVPVEHAYRHKGAATARASHADTGSSGDVASPKRTRPPLVGRGRLCRDSKGLFKPC